MKHPPKVQVYLIEKVFKLPIYILFNFTEKDLIDWEKKRGISPHASDELSVFSGRAYNYRDNDGVYTSVVWIRYFNWNITGLGTLVHELFHVVFRLFEKQNMQVADSNQEFFALIINALYEDACQEYLRHDKKRKSMNKRMGPAGTPSRSARGSPKRAKRAKGRRSRRPEGAQ